MIPARPAITLRDEAGRSFAELVALLGPEAIGVTGDNRYRTLYGRPYALALDVDTRRLRLFRGAYGGGAYEEVVESLPAIVFDVAYPETARRFSAAFDQSARIIVAYEDAADGLVRVTRWTGSEYVQNVTFAGVDPQLLTDITLTDPRGYPNAVDDGWSVREAFEAGILVLFEWLAGDPVVYLENALPDSDVLLFYLSTDRLELRVRVQRQLYATEIVVHTFAEPVILDRVIALAGRYQALVSDATGEPLAEMIISDPYIGDYLIAPEAADRLPSDTAPDGVLVETQVYPVDLTDDLPSDTAPEAIAVTGDTALIDAADDLPSDTAPEAIDIVGSVANVGAADDLPSDTAPDDPLLVITTVEPATEEDPLDADTAPETIRVQTV